MEPLDDILMHFGVKGMKWGVRKNREHGRRQPGYKVHDDGRIEIEPGVKMQRLVTSSKLKDQISRPLNGYSFMSFLPEDNAKYISQMSTKSKAQDLKRDTILVLKTKVDLKSPSLEEARRINMDVMEKHAKELRIFYKQPIGKRKYDSLSKETDAYLGMIDDAFYSGRIWHYGKDPAVSKDLSKYNNEYIKKDYEAVTDAATHPKKYPALLYAVSNASISSRDESTSPYRERLLNSFKSKGFNMIRDENNAASGYAKAPVIVLNPEHNVEIALSKKISRMNLWQAQRYVERGKRDLKSLGL